MDLWQQTASDNHDHESTSNNSVAGGCNRQGAQRYWAGTNAPPVDVRKPGPHRTGTHGTQMRDLDVRWESLRHHDSIQRQAVLQAAASPSHHINTLPRRTFLDRHQSSHSPALPENYERSGLHTTAPATPGWPVATHRAATPQQGSQRNRCHGAPVTAACPPSDGGGAPLPPSNPAFVRARIPRSARRGVGSGRGFVSTVRAHWSPRNHTTSLSAPRPLRSGARWHRWHHPQRPQAGPPAQAHAPPMWPPRRQPPASGRGTSSPSCSDVRNTPPSPPPTPSPTWSPHRRGHFVAPPPPRATFNSSHPHPDPTPTPRLLSRGYIYRAAYGW